MIITKKALPRRTFLRGMGASTGAAPAGCHDPVDDRPGQDAGQSGCAASASSTCRWDAIISRWTPPGEGRLARAFAQPCSSLAPVLDQVTVITNLELKNAYPGTHATSNAAFLSAAKAKWTESTRLLPGHDGRSDRRAADRPGNAAAVARTVDGFAPDRRPVRQRLCLRLPEQSFVVVADHAAAGRGSSAHRFRASVRRGRQRGGSPRRAAEKGQPSRFGDATISLVFRASSARPIAPRSASISIPFARWNAAFRRPRPTRRTTGCPISIVRSAYRPPMPTMRD